MIKVWTDAAEAGLLDRQGERGSTFAYLPDTPDARAVSVTMPVRLPSWTVPFGLPPIFEMNLPDFNQSVRMSRRLKLSEKAVDKMITAGHRSKDLGGTLTTNEVSHAILDCLAS